MIKVACAVLASLMVSACGATVAGELVSPAGTKPARFASCLKGNGLAAKTEDLSFALIQDRLTHGINAWQVRLAASCATLQGIAGDKKISCLPTATEMADFLQAQYPDHPMLQSLRIKIKDGAVKKANAALNGN